MYQAIQGQYRAEQQSTSRIKYIDTAKGICIFLVVLGHCSISNLGLLGVLLMPLFFTLSGFFFKDSGGWLLNLVKKCNKILIPFIFFYTVAFVIVMAKVWAGADIAHSYMAFFFSKDALTINGVLWFLLALFWSNMIFLAIYRISSNIIFLGIVSLLFMGLSLILFSEGNYLPAYFDSGLTAMPFFYFGYFLRNTGILNSDKYTCYQNYIIPALFVLAIICYIIGGGPHVTISCNEIVGCVPLFMLFSVTSIIGVLLLCKVIGTIPFITYIGRYSLIILCIHMPIIETVSHTLLLCGMNIYSFPVNISIFIVAISVSTLLIKPLITWFPKFTAQEDLIVLKPKNK